MLNTKLKNQVNMVLATIQQRKDIERKPVLETIQRKYQRLEVALEQGMNIKECSIRGSVRAYLDAYNDYNDPFIEELHKAEQLYNQALTSFEQFDECGQKRS